MKNARIKIQQSPTTLRFEVILDDKLVASFDQFKGADALADQLREQLKLSYNQVCNTASEGA